MSEPRSTNQPKISFSSRFWNPRDLRDYLLQVTLIILSILIATSVDRCNQAQKEERSLQEYLTAIRSDLVDNIEENDLNLIDCRSDLRGLQHGMALFRYRNPDSLALAVQEVLQVLGRGVFRSFPPTTFESMQATGDVRLIDDLDLRDLLATVFAFQEDYVKTDLQAFDQQITATTEQLGRFLDLACVQQSRNVTNCFLDKEAFLADPHNELFLLYRAAEVREFHLEMANRGLQSALQAIEEQLAR